MNKEIIKPLSWEEELKGEILRPTIASAVYSLMLVLAVRNGIITKHQVDELLSSVKDIIDNFAGVEMVSKEWGVREVYWKYLTEEVMSKVEREIREGVDNG